ncbi:MAG: DsbA family oxidoreductase [Pseudomonadota bacterium]
MVKLDVLSDPICPWCLIGKAQLDRALKNRPDHPFVIEWHPFQLNPDMPRDGMDRQNYLVAKFGSRSDAARVYARIAEAAETAGVNIDFGGIKRTPNTLNAHRLIHWAGIERRQTPVVAALFRAYFEDGRDIGNDDVLVNIAKEAGLDGAMVRQLLSGDADAEDVRARDTHARDRGVTGVPTFVVEHRHVLPGAQPSELWEQVIDEIAAKPAGAT